MSDTVTICIPTYAASAFVTDTLSAVAAQTHEDIRVLISDDASPDDTVGACIPFLADGRFELMSHARRHGWIGNINSLLQRVESEFFVLLPHDDLIAPDYVEVLLAAVVSHESTVNAFCDISVASDHEYRKSLPSLMGSRFDRLVDQSLESYNAIPMRGLSRSAALAHGLRFRPNGDDGFFSECIYVFELAAKGECVRVVGDRYLKRRPPDSVTQRWVSGLTHEQRLDLLASHVALWQQTITGLDLAPDDCSTLRRSMLAGAAQRYWMLPGFFGSVRSFEALAGRLGVAVSEFMPDGTMDPRVEARLHQSLALEALARNDLAAVVVHADRALILHPDYVEALTTRAAAALRLGDRQGAMDRAQAADGLLPGDLRAGRLLASLEA